MGANRHRSVLALQSLHLARVVGVLDAVFTILCHVAHFVQLGDVVGLDKLPLLENLR